VKIEKLSLKFDDLIASDAVIELVAEGFIFTEGPVWNSSGNFLLFSDIPASKIYKWSEEKGIEIYRQNSNFSNGLTYDLKGQLIACEHQSRRVTRELPNGDIEILASHFQGKKLNSPNDIVVSKDGSILFTDPIYGLRLGMGGPADQELSIQGVYRIDPSNNELQLLTDSFERPNGLAFSLDEKHLFIDDTVRQHIRMFTIEDSWHITEGQIWAELWDNSVVGRPDGMKLDNSGNIYCTGPGGIWIFNPQAELLGKIYLDDKTSNLAWGEKGNSLFITCSTRLYKLKCKAFGKIL
jgi:gluconolactonase